MSWIVEQVWIIAVLIPVVLLFYGMRVLREYERGVIFLLGRFWKVKGPGLVLVVPIVQQMVRVDLRIRVLDVPEQDVISRDNVSVRVNAVVYFHVVDAQKAIIQVMDFLMATSQLAQTTLRSVLGQHELDSMLSERDKLNANIQRILDEQTEAYASTADGMVRCRDSSVCASCGIRPNDPPWCDIPVTGRLSAAAQNCSSSNWS